MHRPIVFDVLIHLFDRKLLQASVERQSQTQAGRTLEENIFAAVVSPANTGDQAGYRIDSRAKVIHEREDNFRLCITCEITDAERIVGEAQRRRLACYQEGDWKAETIGKALYEILIAASAGPAPTDCGYEVLDVIYHRDLDAPRVIEAELRTADCAVISWPIIYFDGIRTDGEATKTDEEHGETIQALFKQDEKQLLLHGDLWREIEDGSYLNELVDLFVKTTQPQASDVEALIGAMQASDELWQILSSVRAAKPRQGLNPTKPYISADSVRDALNDLYKLLVWYRDEFGDAEPPPDLVGFNGSSDVVGRARAYLPSNS